VQRGTGRFWSHIQSDGEGWESWTIPGGGSENPTTRPIWQMVGRDVYERAIEVVPDAVRSVVNYAGYEIDDIDWFVPHQASLKVLKEVTARLGIPWSKVAYNLGRYGNTAAASMPTALASIVGKIRPGDLVAFGAVGAGWTWGAGVLEWT
jgi:3-oxoacyl-[acyl-carrier-protein] synthase III